MNYSELYSDIILRKMYAEELASCVDYVFVLPDTYKTLNEDYLYKINTNTRLGYHDSVQEFYGYATAFILTYIDVVSVNTLKLLSAYLFDDFIKIVTYNNRLGKYVIDDVKEHYFDFINNVINENLDHLAEFGELANEPQEIYFTYKRVLRPSHVSEEEYAKACGKHFGKLGKEYGKLSGGAETGKENKAAIAEAFNNWYKHASIGKPTNPNVAKVTGLSETTIKKHIKDSELKEAKDGAFKLYNIYKQSA